MRLDIYKRMRIALDAMGGDDGLEANIEGAGMALETLPSIEKLYLVGDQKKIKEALNKHSIRTEKIAIAHASERTHSSVERLQRFAGFVKAYSSCLQIITNCR